MNRALMQIDYDDFWAIQKVCTQRRGEGGSKQERTSVVLVTSFFC